MRFLHLGAANIDSLKGRVVYLHDEIESDVTAFETNENQAIRILLPRTLGVVSVYVEIYNESLNCLMRRLEAKWNGLFEDGDAFDVALNDFDVGLYFFRVVVNIDGATLFGRRNDKKLDLTTSSALVGLFQLSVCEFTYAEPESKYGGIIYHIFVDRFNRGGKVETKEGSILVEDWSRGIPEYPEYAGAPLKNNTFYGGTLWGIIDKLDYISSLGVDTIYLSPIFEAASNHKYDTADYMTVDSMFGGDEALAELIKRAKEKGIGIILDGVFNHTGSDSIYFNKYGKYKSLGAYQSKKSKYYSWYDFQKFPDKYTCWWGIDILPRINPDNRECGEYIAGENGVISKYSAMGVDGFRLDVVDELSDSFIARIKSRLNVYNAESVLYGEVWEDASNKIAYDRRKTYYLGNELDGVMNYPVRKGIISFLREKKTEDLYYALTDIVNNAPKRIRNMQMNLLGSHDTERIVTLLGAESGAGRSNSYLATARMNDIERGIAKRRLRMAYAILATLPGIPSIFYGDETALEGYSDPFNRMPYPWDSQDMKMVNYYRKVGQIRRQNAVYRDGEFVLKLIERELLVFSRENGDDSYVTLVNNSNRSLRVSFSKNAESLIDSCKAEDSFILPAYTTEIYKTARNNILSVADV